METPSYGRTVTLTHEALAAMSERQAKQKALKEELDRQMMEKRSQGVDTSGLSKAQKKLLELQELRQKQNQQVTSPTSTTSNPLSGALMHQSQSLPANFAMSSLTQQSSLPNVGFRGGGGVPPMVGGPQPSPLTTAPNNGPYDARSLPANYQLMAVQQGVGGYGMAPQGGNANGMLMPSSSAPSFPQQHAYQQQQYNQFAPPQTGNGGWVNPPHQPTSAGSGQADVGGPPPPSSAGVPYSHSVARQVFSINDVMGFVRQATDAPVSAPPPNPINTTQAPPPGISESVYEYDANSVGVGSSAQHRGGGVPPKGKPSPAGTASSSSAAVGPSNGNRLTKARTPLVSDGKRPSSNANPPLSVGVGQRGQSPPGVGLLGGGGGIGMGSSVRAPSSSQSKDRHLQNKLERLTKELESRDQQMHKILEKNRNWEKQAEQLQAQLKEEKKKAKAALPTRAETAPQPTAPVPPMKGKLDPIARPANAAPGKQRTRVSPAGGGVTSPPANMASPNVVGGGNANAPLSHLTSPSVVTSPKSTLVGRSNFNSTMLFTDRSQDDQRPITAPDVMDPTTQLMRSGHHLPPLQQRPSQPPMTRQPLEKESTFSGGGAKPIAIINASANKPLPLHRQTFSPRHNKGELPIIEDDTNEESIRYAGDPTAVRREEERVMAMMGSGAGFAFHSRRSLEQAPPQRNSRVRHPSMGAADNSAPLSARGVGSSRQQQQRESDYDDEGEASSGDGRRRRDGGASARRYDDDGEEAAELSALFSLDHLQWFVTIQLITAQQARKLWSFFAGCDESRVPIDHVIPEGYEDADDFVMASRGDEEGGDDGTAPCNTTDTVTPTWPTTQMYSSVPSSSSTSAKRSPIPPPSSAAQPANRHYRRHPSANPSTSSSNQQQRDADADDNDADDDEEEEADEDAEDEMDAGDDDGEEEAEGYADDEEGDEYGEDEEEGY